MRLLTPISKLNRFLNRATSTALLLALGLIVSIPALAETESFSVDNFKSDWIAKRGLTDEAKSLDFSRQSELVHQALIRFDKQYRQSLMVAVTPELSVKAWNEYLKRDGLDKYSEAEARFQLSLAHVKSENYEQAVEQLEKIEMASQQFSPRRAELRLFTAYCYGKLEDSARAIRVLSDMIARQPDCPERYRELALWFRRELRGQGTGPLLELSKSMEYVERLLRKSETGFNPTGKRQQDIVKQLNRLIDLLENKKKGGDCKDCKNPKNSKKQGKKNGGSKPMDDSKLPGGNPNVGNLQREPERGVSEAWGKLKDAERKDVIEAIRQRFPGQYKELIEQYFKNMSDKSSDSKPGDSNN